jgi:hypothetical protein
MRNAIKFPKDLAQHVRSQLVAPKGIPPPVEVSTSLFETLYFASLQREENQPISCRLAFIDRRRPDPDPPKRIRAQRSQVFALANDLGFRSVGVIAESVVTL